ncbi:MAG: hypothetical protein LUQ65_14980, partial [Candidatus Helarchaeota archaeon]|nr:hypothetical protein [Candidatus Helarchaeota archaeon]
GFVSTVTKPVTIRDRAPRIVYKGNDRSGHENNTLGIIIQWKSYDFDNDSDYYEIYQDALFIENNTWSNDEFINYTLPQLKQGTYRYLLKAYDKSGVAVQSSINITVLPLGYGTSFSNAEFINPPSGTHSKTFYTYDNNSYYKIYCQKGQTLRIQITYSAPTYNLDLSLYNQSLFYINGSFSTGASDTVEYINTSSGYYYFVVIREKGSGDISYSLTISAISPNPPVSQIPGFDILFVIFGVLMVIGIVSKRVFKRSSKVYEHHGRIYYRYP